MLIEKCQKMSQFNSGNLSSECHEDHKMSIGITIYVLGISLVNNNHYHRMFNSSSPVYICQQFTQIPKSYVAGRPDGFGQSETSPGTCVYV